MPITHSKNRTFKCPRISSRRRLTLLHIGMIGGLFIISQPQQSIAADYAKANANILHTAPSATKLQNTLWWQVATRHQIDPYVLYAVALVESRKHGEQNHVTPWPWAINNAGKSFIPQSQQEAEVLLNKMLDEGRRNVDVGIMQVNLRWHGHRVAKPEHLLNPNTNLEIGARLLAEAIQSAPNNLALGVGRYYSWKNVPAAVEYGQQVIALAEQIRTLI